MKFRDYFFYRLEVTTGKQQVKRVTKEDEPYTLLGFTIGPQGIDYLNPEP